MARLLLCLYLLLSPNLILRYSVTPRFQISNAQGHALRPLVILVKADAACQQIGIVVDGPKSYVSQKDIREGITLRVEYTDLITGVYSVTLACLDSTEGILQLVNAGTVEVT
jgi:hypothetical protein